MFDLQIIRAAYGFKIWFAATEEFLYLPSTYSVSVLKTVSKYDLS